MPLKIHGIENVHTRGESTAFGEKLRVLRVLLVAIYSLPHFAYVTRPFWELPLLFKPNAHVNFALMISHWRLIATFKSRCTVPQRPVCVVCSAVFVSALLLPTAMFLSKAAPL